MSDVVVYSDGELELNISVNDETVWLTQKQLGDLFGVEVHTVNYHIKNIFKQKELEKNATIRKIRIVQKEGKREVQREVEHYNLDMAISIGYRVNSKTATRFRQWASSVLKEYIQNGYAINQEKLTQQRLLSLENDLFYIKSHIQENTLELKQGLFFDGQIFDAYTFISDLIKSAKSSIVLIDNYVDESVLTLLSKNPNVKTTLYTHTVSKQLKLDIEKYNQQYGNLSVQTNKKFHDRFMIIDGKETYHIGASLKDAGKKVFALSKMTLDVKDILK